ncbi:MAG TPA: HAMP domain-containing sensor histidine kinase [Acidobacteriota bacterium]|nr:HAMP domain-containing sensor histidine kinase [Acidobacteriota bacterium]
MSFSVLSIVILFASAWVINSQAVAGARLEVQQEMKTSLPLYDAVWREQAGRLSTLGMAMAGSPIVKAIFGDSRAARDRETIHQMLLEFGHELTENVDMILISDGGGSITFAEGPDSDLPGLKELPAARAVATDQKAAESFMILGGRLFHLALIPVTLHSESADFNNTLAVLVAGSELNRKMAIELKQRAHSDVLFFAGDRLYASSLEPEAEADAARTVAVREIGRREPDQPAELMIHGESQFAFARMLAGLDGRQVGYVVVLHSLGSAGKLLHAVSNRLVLIGTISLILVLMVSYFVARRVTQPLESLAAGAIELGRGNYEYQIDLSPNGEVGQLASAFEQMRQSIRQGQAVLLRSERLATVGQMASGIIHDLRGPLAAISNAAELFSRTELSPGQRQVLAESQLRASLRMGAMLREILEYSNGNYELNLERRQLAAVVKTVVQESVTSDVAPGVGVEVNIPPNLFVLADYDRVRRIFENLVANSVQAMPQGGTIRIRSSEVGNQVRISVADTGPGIPAQLRDRLFEPFVSQGKQGGTGLGLAIARRIAEAHGGSLTLVSSDGQPAEFCVELPLVSET